MNVALVSGGTGGHIYPALSLLRHLQKQGAAVEFFTSENPTALKILTQEKVAFRSITCAPLVGQNGFQKLKAIFYNWKGLLQARRALKNMNAECVVGFGAYASLPVIAAAWTLRIPYILHEQNPHPGAANKILSRAAAAVALSFAETQTHFRHCRTELIGNLLRPEIFEMSSETNVTEQTPKNSVSQRKNNSRKTVLIVGGSGGAKSVNRWMAQSASALQSAGENLHFIHVSGSAEESALLKAAYAQNNISADILDYAEKIWELYAQTDLIVARAGATTIAELAALKLPAILIPYPFALGHQKANALILQRIGSARILEESAPRPALAQTLLEILTNAKTYETMRRGYENFPIDLRQALPKMQKLIEEICRKK